VCGKHLADGEGEYGSRGLMCNPCAANVKADEEFPCQRCGMYLPKHELQMFKSRLFCNYCIMDLRDEERIHEQAAAGSGHPGAHEAAVSLHAIKKGHCNRCGRGAEVLYTVAGMQLCERCRDQAHPGADYGPNKPMPFGTRALVFVRSAPGSIAKLPAKVIEAIRKRIGSRK
jgi:hypothetical protein